MNITITCNYDHYLLSLSNILLILIVFTLTLLIFCSIIGFISYIVARIIDRMTVGYKSTDIIIGDNGEKLLLINTSDIEGIKSYLSKLPDRDDIKYVFSFSTKETYEVINGLDLTPTGCYDKHK